MNKRSKILQLEANKRENGKGIVGGNGSLVRVKKEPRKTLTLAEKRLLRALIQGKKPKEAAYLATNASNDNTAKSMASQMMKRERFQKALEKAGLTDQALAKAFVEGLSANRPVIVNKAITDYPDHATRHQFVKTALVVKDYYKRTDDPEDSHRDPLIVNAIQMVNQTVNVGK